MTSKITIKIKITKSISLRTSGLKVQHNMLEIVTVLHLHDITDICMLITTPLSGCSTAISRKRHGPKTSLNIISVLSNTCV